MDIFQIELDQIKREKRIDYSIIILALVFVISNIILENGNFFSIIQNIVYLFMVFYGFNYKNKKKSENKKDNIGDFLFLGIKKQIIYDHYIHLYALFFLMLVSFFALFDDKTIELLGDSFFIVIVTSSVFIIAILLLMKKYLGTNIIIYENLIDMGTISYRLTDITKCQFIKLKDGNYYFEFRDGNKLGNVLINKNQKGILERLINSLDIKST